MTKKTLLTSSALLASLGPLVGNGIYAGPEGTGQERLDVLAQGLPTPAYVAMALEIAGFLAAIVLLGILSVRLRDRAPVAAVVTAIAAAAATAVKLATVAPVMVAYRDAEALGADLVDALVAIGGMGFVLYGLLLSTALCAVGVGLLRTETSRWLAWWPAVAGALGVVAGGVGVAAPDSYVPIPFLLLLLWMIALAVVTAMSRTDDAEGAVGANPALTGVGH
ncbi:MAG TPA: hypothetical protein VFK41_01340 [Nocardioidaceae bacterium]|nr:hypothetical protein [Nocardioidaceae bacterium]